MSESFSNPVTPEQFALSDRFIQRVTAMLPAGQDIEQQGFPDLWSGHGSHQKLVADYELVEPIIVLTDTFRYISAFRLEYDGGNYFYGLDLRRDVNDYDPHLSLYSDSGDDDISADGLEPVLGINPLPLRKQDRENQESLVILFNSALGQLDATVARPLGRAPRLTMF